jgi:hypothetical protein
MNNVQLGCRLLNFLHLKQELLFKLALKLNIPRMGRHMAYYTAGNINSPAGQVCSSS